LEHLPTEFRKRALTILRHYPSPREIKDAAAVGERTALVGAWLAPQDWATLIAVIFAKRKKGLKTPYGFR
jgi:hypothetical protein